MKSFDPSRFSPFNYVLPITIPSRDSKGAVAAIMLERAMKSFAPPRLPPPIPIPSRDRKGAVAAITLERAP